MSDDEAITQPELTDALKRVLDGSAPEPVFLRNPQTAAAAIFANVRLHREPEYAQDDRVEDAEGVAWQRVPGNQWVRMGRAEWYDDDKPKRPLRKLVPEGSQRKVTRAQVLGILCQRSTLDAAEPEADDIMDLLDGAQ